MPDALYISRKIYYVNEGESLSGYVQEKSASDIEERTAIALSKLQISYAFQERVNPLVGLTEVKQNIVGEAEIDFLCEYLGRLYPILVQGEISHFMTEAQAIKDEQKVAIIDTALAPYKAHPSILVPFTKLKNQDDADRFYKYNFLNGWATEFYEP